MDWITGLQKAIDYAEAHITETVDYEELAKQANSSGFHFQRVFSILCGFTLGDYIRMRRLSMAGNELSASGAKVIDVALKYGYDSPESFSRAFTRFHGISPSQAKQGGVVLKSFSPISVKLVLDGGNVINYRIETIDSFRFICRKMKVSGKSEMRKAEITGFWQTCMQDGTISALSGCIPPDSIFGDSIVGATFGKDAAETDFPYAIGTVYCGNTAGDSRLTIEEIPAHTYAVFTCTGKAAEAFPKLCRQIFSEFFPASEYQPAAGADFEAYPSADVTNPDYTCEIWVAVEKKNI